MAVMRIGFTGTPKMPTYLQLGRLETLLRTEQGSELHHGDCVGADEAAHYVAGDCGLKRILHPPTNDKGRAFCGAEEEREPAGYHVRNHAIVDETELLIAMPAGPEKSYPRAGEWAAVRYARKQGKRIVLIWPDGRITTEDWSDVS